MKLNKKLDFFKIYWIITEILKENPTTKMLALVKMLQTEIEKTRSVKVKFNLATDEDIREHVEGEIAEERNRTNE